MRNKLPAWIQKGIRTRKARERYFIRRYGSLTRMHAIDGKWQEKIDDENIDDEMAIMAERTPGPQPPGWDVLVLNV